VLSIGSELGGVLWIEFNPMLILEFDCVFELKRNDRTFFFFVGPIPKRNCLWFIISKGDQVLIIHGKIEALDTIWMWIEESSNWGSRERIPNNKHGVLSTIGGDDPSLIFRAHGGCNLITVTLEQLLLLVHIIINNT